MYESILIAITFVVSAVLGAVAVKFLDRLAQRDAESKAREILHRAEQDAATRVKEADLEIKTKALETKAQTEKELNRFREELRDRERTLDKRHDALEQQGEDLRKQERMVEQTQRKLAERLEEANRRGEEMAKVLDMQRQTLHHISGLDQDEATKRLLTMLQDELQQEAGSMILRHEKKLAETCQSKCQQHRYVGGACHCTSQQTS